MIMVRNMRTGRMVISERTILAEGPHGSERRLNGILVPGQR